jgi:hypothetical protein
MKKWRAFEIPYVVMTNPKATFQLRMYPMIMGHVKRVTTPTPYTIDQILDIRRRII